MNPADPLYQILDLARWAPSGDNTQPWRFEVLGERHVVVHGFDTRDHCVYDIDGRPSQMSIGALLETLDIAASRFNQATETIRRPGPDERPTFDVRFSSAPARPLDSLAEFITVRSVQRRPLRTRALLPSEKAALEAAVGRRHSLIWLEGWGQRWACARLMFANAKIRLTMPEAYEVHRSIIDWGLQHSDDKVPDQALGADALTLKLMRFAMQSWPRIEFMNRWLAGTVAPRLQMDLLPGLACAAHFVIVARTPPNDVDDWVAAGRAMQRLWLTATKLGLQKQPELTPVVFARYVGAARDFSRIASLHDDARWLSERLANLLGVNLDTVVWMARIGAGDPPRSRSLRMSLDQLTSSVAAKRPASLPGARA
jgi:hypothetical protein